MIKNGGTETVDAKAVGAILVKGTQWYGYDNAETVKAKVTIFNKHFVNVCFLRSTSLILDNCLK